MTKPVVFRLRPERGALYVRVVVHPTRNAMLAHLRDRAKHGRGHGFSGAIATCTDWIVWRVKRGSPIRRHPCVAEVNFFRRRLGTEIITHEFFHATIAWGRRIRFNWQRFGDDDSVNQDEERLTYVHGRLVRMFVDRAHAAGLY